MQAWRRMCECDELGFSLPLCERVEGDWCGTRWQRRQDTQRQRGAREQVTPGGNDSQAEPLALGNKSPPFHNLGGGQWEELGFGGLEEEGIHLQSRWTGILGAEGDNPFTPWVSYPPLTNQRFLSLSAVSVNEPLTS